MPVKKVVFLSYSPIRTALEHLRVLGPLSHTEIEVINGIEEDKPNLDIVRSGDLVIFQRNFSSRFRAYMSVMDEAHKNGIPVVMDLDDYLIGLPQDHPDRKWSPFAFELPALLHAINNVDAITVTTPTLKSVVEQYNKNVFVLPNFLDDSIWTFNQKQKEEKPSTIRIAFVGTNSHQPDLEKIANPLKRIVEIYKQKVSFLFYGVEVPGLIKDLENIQYQAPVTYDYAEFAIKAGSISADIAIAPLGNTLFNRCKSPIKYMEYTAMGMPGVYSNIVPYNDVIRDGINGFLAEKPDEWIEKISRLIDDQNLRDELLTNAQLDVRLNWMMHDHARLWQDCYDQILDHRLQNQCENPAFLLALGQIAEQIEEQVLKQAQQTAILNQVLQETQNQNIALEDKLLREAAHAAELLFAEKEHSSNLLKERDLFKKESEKKSVRLEDLTARTAELEELNKNLSEQNSRELQQLIQEKQALAKTLEQLQREHQEFQASIINLTQENQNMMDALDHLRKENQDYKKLNQQLDLQKSIAQEDVTRLESELKDLRTNLEAKLIENNSIRAELEELHQGITGIYVQNEGASSRISELEEQNRRLLVDLENTKREVVDYVMSDSWKITRPLRRIAKFFKRR